MTTPTRRMRATCCSSRTRTARPARARTATAPTIRSAAGRPAFGVVDINWTTRTFPDNIPWDYAYYVVKDSGAYTAGLTTVNAALDVAVPPITVSFATPTLRRRQQRRPTTPRRSAIPTATTPTSCTAPRTCRSSMRANWWLASCGLSGGSSGGPWMQPFTNGDGSLISVNSWGYTNQPGMYGPKLSGTSASCVFARREGGQRHDHRRRRRGFDGDHACP